MASPSFHLSAMGEGEKPKKRRRREEEERVEERRSCTLARRGVAWTTSQFVPFCFLSPVSSSLTLNPKSQVPMDLQLYRIGQSTFLVDFRNLSYRAAPSASSTITP